MATRRGWIVGALFLSMSGLPAQEKAATEQIPAPKRSVYRLDRNDESAFECVAFSPDDKWMAAVTDRHDLRIWDITRGDEVGQLQVDLPSHNSCRSLVFSPDNKRLAATFKHGYTDQPRFLVGLWDVQADGRPNNFRKLLAEKRDTGATPHVCHHVSFSPDSRTVTAGSPNRFVYLWETATGAERLSFKGGIASAFTPDGRELVTVDFDGTIERRDPATGIPLQAGARDRSGFHYVNTLVFAPDRQTVALRDGYTLKIKNVLTDRTLGQFEHRGSEPLAFASDGQVLSVGSDTGLGFLDAKSGRLRSWFRVEKWHPVFRNAGKELAGIHHDTVVVQKLTDLLQSNDKLPELPLIEPEAATLSAEVIANKETYYLDTGAKSAEEFSKLLIGTEPPPTPTVDLTLRLKNTGKREIKIHDHWDRLSLHVVGDGAVNVPTSVTSWFVAPPTNVSVISLAPGATRSLRITSLEQGWQAKDRSYWVLPGEYQLHVTFDVMVSPGFGKVREGREVGFVKIHCDPVKLTVLETKK